MILNKLDRLLLEAFRASLREEKVDWEFEITSEEWKQLFCNAETHKILPMIYDAVYNCPAIATADQGFLMAVKRSVKQSVMYQVIKTGEFLNLYKHLNEKGIYPLLVKGIVCRSIYPKSDYRSSGDEDMLIPPEVFGDCHKAMLEYGMVVTKNEEGGVDEYEVPYGKQGSPINIELHKSLFPQESEAYGELNRYFEKVHDTFVTVNVQGTEVRTLNPTDHFFYLICHAFKHFLHSGFGIRQVSDILMFGKRYGNEIDWTDVLRKCKEIRADKFVAALVKIGEKYLVFNPVKAGYPIEWQQIEVDESALLQDLLDSGIYGDADMSRKHSSTITLNAVKAQKEGKEAKTNVFKTIFPPLASMKGRYTYLEKYPFLLPAAWVARILRYGKESRSMEGNSASESIKIGAQRIDLMKQYGIIDK